MRKADSENGFATALGQNWQKATTTLPQLWVKIGRRQPRVYPSFESKSAEGNRKREKGLKDIYNNETRKKDWEKPIQKTGLPQLWVKIGRRQP